MNIEKKASDEALARCEAEDQAFSYLAHGNRFAPSVARAISIRVEFLLAVIWEDLQEEMRERRDPREVRQISLYQMREIRDAFAATAPGLSNAVAEQHLVDLLRTFPP